VVGGEPDKERVDIMQLERVPTESGAILYEPSRLAHRNCAAFDPVLLQSTGRLTRAAKGRGSAWFIEPDDTGPALALRHYRRGGLIARWVQSSYLWTGEDATRCFRELRLLAHLEDLGLPAARPVAALYERTGRWTYRAALLTERIVGARPLSGYLAQTDHRLWQRVGATIAAFHAAGVCHADLNAHNVLIDPVGAVYLIDFDRGVLRRPGTWRASNLARLARSLAKVGGPAVDSTAWAALLEGYGAPLRAPRR
jgi:3-deoxy-D-manno-octulosonic acid kinase